MGIARRVGSASNTPMDPELTPIEMRVLGALMEKAVTTPEYYPMSLNGLTNACNQKTSRDPVTDYDEDAVQETLDGLRDRGLVLRVDVSGSRVPKFRTSIREKWELEDEEYALLAILLLRGAQTVGQLRSRAERLFAFRDISEVNETLDTMQRRDFEPLCLVRPLPLQPGSKEVRFIQTVGEPPELLAPESGNGFSGDAPVRATIRMDGGEELTALREEVATLKEALEGLRAEFEAFKAQF